MTTRAYTVLGWIVWKVGSRMARRKLRQNRVKAGAITAVALTILAAALAVRGAKRGASEPE